MNTEKNPKRLSAQMGRVKDRLDRGLPITSLDGFTKLGIVHIPSVIRDLKEYGYPISDKWVKGRNRYEEKVKFKVWRKKSNPEPLSLF